MSHVNSDLHIVDQVREESSKGVNAVAQSSVQGIRDSQKCVGWEAP